MADSDVGRLEDLLATVMPLLAARDDPHPGMTLPMAEAALLVSLLTAGNGTQQQLADRLRLDKSRVSRLCAALERKRLITRERDDANRRTVQVRITEAGSAAAGGLRRGWRERHERLLAALAPDERQALLTGLAAVARELPALAAGTGRARGATG